MSEGAKEANRRMYEQGINYKLDRIIELLESFKVPVVIYVTNPPNPMLPYDDKVGWPISPGPTCECNHEARELIHPDLGPNITYTSSYNETPQRFWNERGVEIMPGTEHYKICKAICEGKEKGESDERED